MGNITDLQQSTTYSVSNPAYPYVYGAGDYIPPSKLNFINQSRIDIWQKSLSSIGCIQPDRNGNIYVSNGYNTARVLTKFNSYGGVIWQLADVPNNSQISMDLDGDIYVAYYNWTGTKTIRKLNASGIEIWSSSDIGHPLDLEVDANKNLYVTYTDMNYGGGTGSKVELRKFDYSGASVWTVLNQIDTEPIECLAVDIDGNIIVTYTGNTKSLRKFDPSGTILWTNFIIQSALYLTTDSNRNIYVPFDNGYGSSITVAKLNSSGNAIWTNNDAGSAVCIDLDSNNNVFVTYLNDGISDNGITFEKMNSSGIKQWSLSDVTNAQCVAVGNDGYIYVGYDNWTGVSLRKMSEPLNYTITG